MNIDEMEAGRELDALVAEKIRGWIVLPDGDGGASPDPAYKGLIESDARKPIPNYSTDRNDSWALVEQFAHHSRSLFFEEYLKQFDDLQDLFLASDEEVALAHCHAALKVIEAANKAC
jgi:hypothetical protein